MNHSDEKRKVARSRRATSETTSDGWPIVSSTHYDTTNYYDCQMRDDALTLEDALDLKLDDEWQTDIQLAVERCMMTPDQARRLGYCPDWLPEAYAAACAARDMPVRL